MTIQQFKTAAAGIEADPLKRLSKVTKDLVERNNYVFDAHIHIFDRKCVPVKYFLLRLIKERLGFERTVEMTAEENEALEQINEIYKSLENGPTDEENEFDELFWSDALFQNEDNLRSLNILSISDALKVVLKGNMSEILDFFNENFALNNFEKFRNYESLTVVLSMDLEMGWGKKTKRTYLEQISDLHKIAITKPMLPFFAIDPRRAEIEGENNLYKMFIDAFTNEETPFFGVKCYPALGYYPFDERLMPIFEICAEKNIPIVTHCGGTIISTFGKRVTYRDAEGVLHEQSIPFDTREELAEFFNDPMKWDTVLQKYPNLKVNFAHFGGPNRWISYIAPMKDRIDFIAYLMDTYKHVFADYSFNLMESDSFKNLKTAFKDDLIKARTIYGTDYWVVLPKGDLKESIANFIEEFETEIMDLVLHNPNNFLFSKNITA